MIRGAPGEEDSDSDNSYYSFRTALGDTSPTYTPFGSLRSIDSDFSRYEPARENFHTINKVNSTEVFNYNSSSVVKLKSIMSESPEVIVNDVTEGSAKKDEKKKKGIRMSFKKKKNKGLNRNEDYSSGIDSDLNSPSAPSTPVGTLERNVSPPDGLTNILDEINSAEMNLTGTESPILKGKEKSGKKFGSFKFLKGKKGKDENVNENTAFNVDDNVETDDLTSPLKQSPIDSNEERDLEVGKFNVDLDSKAAIEDDIKSPKGKSKKVKSPKSESNDIKSPKSDSKDAKSPKSESKDAKSPKSESKDAKLQKSESKDIETPKKELKVVETPKFESKVVETPTKESKDAKSPTKESKDAKSPTTESKGIEEEIKSEDPGEDVTGKQAMMTRKPARVLGVLNFFNKKEKENIDEAKIDDKTKEIAKEEAAEESEKGLYNEEKSEYLYKVLVIGELGTGKTSIIKRYVHQFFCQHYRATIGVDFALKVIHWDEKTLIRVQLWDIAGQERFGNMTRVYYKQAVAAFIVFDMSNSKTFDAVTKWKTDLDNKVTLPDGSPIPVVLLANKCDQVKDVNEYSTQKMDAFCREKNFAGWFHTSAKENINIEQSTKFLIAQILKNEKNGLMPLESYDKERISINKEQFLVAEEENKKCAC